MCPGGWGPGRGSRVEDMGFWAPGAEGPQTSGRCWGVPVPQGPWARPRGAARRGAASPGHSARPPSLPPLLGRNHVYKLWKNPDILQKKTKTRTKNIHKKPSEVGGLAFPAVSAASSALSIRPTFPQRPVGGAAGSAQKNDTNHGVLKPGCCLDPTQRGEGPGPGSHSPGLHLRGASQAFPQQEGRVLGHSPQLVLPEWLQRTLSLRAVDTGNERCL